MVKKDSPVESLQGCFLKEKILTVSVKKLDFLSTTKYNYFNGTGKRGENVVTRYRQT